MRYRLASFVARIQSAMWLALDAIVKLFAAGFISLFAPPKTNQSRRDLLQGRIWKFIPSAKFPPLVMRYPTQIAEPSEHHSPQVKPRSIAGINIDPVPATDLGRRSVAQTLPVFRPPGAIDEFQFLSGCTRCGDCITACPYEAIRKAPERLGSRAGTPIIEADAAACMMCSDFPCIDACEPGVLTKLLPPIMGTAKVTEHLCLAHHHTICTVCSERCPVDSAITVTDGKPIVNEETCTGCGVCRYVCPAPENAILLMPVFLRPGLPSP
ncbi:MAG: 4Fe-4S dicluster domain-containing protein [Planctomycetales bacterium]|nr:4Fe-4S dicluster domain-containing protein [Planctomycetales bacterium]